MDLWRGTGARRRLSLTATRCLLRPFRRVGWPAAPTSGFRDQMRNAAYLYLWGDQTTLIPLPGETASPLPGRAPETRVCSTYAHAHWHDPLISCIRVYTKTHDIGAVDRGDTDRDMLCSGFDTLLPTRCQSVRSIDANCVINVQHTRVATHGDERGTVAASGCFDAIRDAGHMRTLSGNRSASMTLCAPRRAKIIRSCRE